MTDKPAESAVERVREAFEMEPGAEYPKTKLRRAKEYIGALEAENEALRREATDLLDAVYQTVMPEEGDRIVREAFCYSEPAWVEAWMREHPTQAEAEARAELAQTYEPCGGDA